MVGKCGRKYSTVPLCQIAASGRLRCAVQQGPPSCGERLWGRQAAIDGPLRPPLPGLRLRTPPAQRQSGRNPAGSGPYSGPPSVGRNAGQRRTLQPGPAAPHLQRHQARPADPGGTAQPQREGSGQGCQAGLRAAGCSTGRRRRCGSCSRRRRRCPPTRRPGCACRCHRPAACR